jgi:short-subunit dehydrogenase
LGAIGLSAAKWLASNGARHLVLVGRRAPSANALRTIREIEQLGVTIAVRPADVSSREELAAVVDEIRHLMPPLAGIVHAAGVLEDGVIEQQTAQRVRRVLLPKVAGAWNLHELTKVTPLDFFFLFSSIASVTGSPAQAGYAAANAWMDALSHFRNSQGLAALSINWGPWSGGGMASEVDAGGKRRSLKALRPMRQEEYWHCLENAARSHKCQVAILDADWSDWTPLPSVLSDLARTRSEARATAPPKETFAKRLSKTPQQNRRALLLDYMRAQARQILGLSPSYVVDEREPLIRLGLDSLMAVELRNQISAALERPLMATLLFDHPSLSSLADFLLGANKAVEAHPDALLDEIQAISEDETEELLQQELEGI